MGSLQLNHPTQIMETIEINLINNKKFRASEIIADLKSISETLYFPMQMVGFWDKLNNNHLCPSEQQLKKCTHIDSKKEISLINYQKSLSRERRASLQITFSHASIVIYLA